MSRSSDHSRAGWVQSIFDTHERRLLCYALHLTGEVEQARDVVQDAMLRLWQCDRERVQGHVTQWLYTVCRNRATDLKRKDMRLVPALNGQLEAVSANGVGGSPAEREESSSSALAALARLPARQQEALRLKFQHGLSYREIAAVMGLTINHVGVLIHNGLKTLRERLDPDRRSGSLAAVHDGDEESP